MVAALICWFECYDDREHNCPRGCGVKLLNYVEEDWLQGIIQVLPRLTLVHALEYL